MNNHLFLSQKFYENFKFVKVMTIGGKKTGLCSKAKMPFNFRYIQVHFSER